MRRTTAITPMLIGLALTVVAATVAALDPVLANLVGQHVREAYPQWDPGTVSTERTAIIGWLVGTAALGVIGWLSSIWAVRRRKRRAPWVATAWLTLGLLTAGLTLGTGGAAYDVIVPTPLGLLSTLPLLPGAVAVFWLWRDRTRPTVTDRAEQPVQVDA